MAAPDVKAITREQWILECFPEWGEWLIEDIEETAVRPGTFALWWLGCTGIWVKSEGGTNISIDMFSGNAKISHYSWAENHKGENFQLGRMNGSNMIHQNPRNIPHVIDPFRLRSIDAFVVTHDHADHMDPYSTAGALAKPGIPFIGPRFSAEKWRKWGVPDDRIIQVKPGDTVKIGDIELIAVDSFDRTALITVPPAGSIRGRFTDDMDDRAVNYIVRTPGGTLYHSGDSHYSNYAMKHGKMFPIDVATAPFGENPPGVTDKMNASEVLRFAEALNCKVMIPIHHDLWPTFFADPEEIMLLYDFKKDRMKYKFQLYIWQVGGKFIFPDDRDGKRYMYPRGFEDAFENEPNLPYKAYF